MAQDFSRSKALLKKGKEARKVSGLEDSVARETRKAHGIAPQNERDADDADINAAACYRRSRPETRPSHEWRGECEPRISFTIPERPSRRDIFQPQGLNEKIIMKGKEEEPPTPTRISGNSSFATRLVFRIIFLSVLVKISKSMTIKSAE